MLDPCWIIFLIQSITSTIWQLADYCFLEQGIILIHYSDTILSEIQLTFITEPGNELPSELIQTLLKMAPTTEEELKLRLYSGELSKLGPAERFLKVLVDIPFAFKRLESLLFMCTLQEETSTLKESFVVLEVRHQPC